MLHSRISERLQSNADQSAGIGNAAGHVGVEGSAGKAEIAGGHFLASAAVQRCYDLAGQVKNGAPIRPDLLIAQHTRQVSGDILHYGEVESANDRSQE